MLQFGRNEIREALEEGGPVVALETAVLTHGLPRPHNLDVVLRMQSAVREAGAIPAVIGVLNGRLTIGLRPDQLEELSRNPAAVKISVRDIAVASACGQSGGTTVSATLAGAQLAGIRILATGGIGGVHRGWTAYPDISADLLELAQTPCCVVASGAKSVLDLRATLEMLETMGIPVVGFRTDWFPQFYTLGSDDLPVPQRVDEVGDMARICRIHWTDLKREGGLFLANPIPEEHAMDADVIETAVGHALREADQQGIQGRDVTPFLLEAVAAATGGTSIEANLALLENNARLAGELAVELAV